MPVSPETKAAVMAECARGDTRAAVARRHGLTRNQVIGLWTRRPAGTEVVREAGPDPAPAEGPPAWTPETAPFTGQAATVWRALLAAGRSGASAEEILAALYAGRARPTATKSIISVSLVRLRDAIKPHGCRIALVPNAKPTRWRIVEGREVGSDAPAAALPAMAAAPSPVSAARPAPTPPAPGSAPPAPPPPSPAPTPSPLATAFAAVASRPSPLAPPRLTGAAAAVAGLRPGCCRWPFGDLHAGDFRFCNAVVERPVVTGATGVERANSYCEEHRAAAKGARQPGPVKLGRGAPLGFGAGQPARLAGTGRAA